MKKRILASLLSFMMLFCMLPVSVMATGNTPTGEVSRGMYSTSNNRIQGAVMNANPTESVVLELYSGETKLATTTLTNKNYLANAATELTWSFCITDTSSSWNTVWEAGHPASNAKPDKVLLYIDGVKVAENTVTLHKNNFDMVGEEAIWADLHGVKSGTIAPAIVNNRDPKINAEWVTIYSEATICGTESMVVKLYSGDELLGTTTLVDTKMVLLNGNNNPVTWHFFLVGEDDWWNTELAQKLTADKAPTRTELWVDGVKVDDGTVSMCNTNDNLAGDEIYYVWGDLDGVTKGEVSRGMYSTSNNRIQGAVMNATPIESVVLELYSGETKLATTTLTNKDYLANAATELTWSFCITDTSSSWNTVWENGMPRADLKPDKVVLYIDGVKVAENTVTLHKNNFDMVGDEAVWADLEGVNPEPPKGNVSAGAYSTSDNRIKGAVTGANAQDSIHLELYSGNKLIATSTLINEDYLEAAKNELTWNFCITGTSSSFETKWESGMPRADYKPTKVVLYVDGDKVDENIVTLHKDNYDQLGDEADWATLEGVNPVPADDNSSSSRPSRPSAPTRYAITVEKTKNGDVTASHKSASKGSTVTITVAPDEGYELDTLVVLDKNGDEIELKNKGDNKFTFKMPAGKVTVEAEFALAEVEPTWDNPFNDVDEDDWFYTAVSYVEENGLMSGMTADSFGPNAYLTRAMLAQVLYNLDEDAKPGSPAFTDVKGEWFADAVNWAYEMKVVSGLGNGQFGPNNNITREQLATILYNYANQKGYIVTGGEDISDFPDADETSAWAVGTVEWAVGNGLISGRTNGDLNPQGNATRGEIASVLMNFCEKIIK